MCECVASKCTTIEGQKLPKLKDTRPLWPNSKTHNGRKGVANAIICKAEWIMCDNAGTPTYKAKQLLKPKAKRPLWPKFDSVKRRFLPEHSKTRNWSNVVTNTI